jgi:hypothetical protein
MIVPFSYTHRGALLFRQLIPYAWASNEAKLASRLSSTFASTLIPCIGAPLVLICMPSLVEGPQREVVSPAIAMLAILLSRTKVNRRIENSESEME